MVYRCDYYKISRDQQKSEDSHMPNRDGTQGFEDRGCYVCDGYDTSCNAYSSILKLKHRLEEKVE